MEKQELVAVNSEIDKINDRVEKIERIARTVEDVVEKGVEAFVKHLEHKEETQQKELDLEQVKHQRELDLENAVHKRSVFIISGTVFCVVVLVFTAMLLGEHELVKTILTSSLAVGAGFGIRSTLTNTKKS